jgi:hypothetical protein
MHDVHDSPFFRSMMCVISYMNAHRTFPSVHVPALFTTYFVVCILLDSGFTCKDNINTGKRPISDGVQFRILTTCFLPAGHCFSQEGCTSPQMWQERETQILHCQAIFCE